MLDGKIAIGRKLKNTVVINQILQRKGIDIFKERGGAAFKSKGENEENIDILLESRQEPYKLNDDIKSEINMNENFESITYLVDKTERVTLLDYEKCLQLCKKIESEKNTAMIMDLELT